MLPLGEDDTPYRLLTNDGVSTFEAAGKTFLQVEPEALTLLTREAMRDIAHLLRPGHLQQLANILDDPEASANDRFVALELLKNANIAAGGVLPCARTPAPRSSWARRASTSSPAAATRRPSPAASSRPTTTRTCATRRWRRSTCTRRSTPAPTCRPQIEIYATDGDAYKFLFMAKGGGSANKSYLFQETKALLNPDSLMKFLDEKLRTLGTAACPPYHLAIVIGGTSAEYALKTAKLASARYLDTLPTERQRPRPRLPRRRARGRRCCKLTQQHRHRRAVRRQVLLPRRARHPPAPPRRLAARSPSPCPARPTARRSARSPPTASSSSSSRPTRRKYLPETTDTRARRRGRARSTSTGRWREIRAELSTLPGRRPACR